MIKDKFYNYNYDAIKHVDYDFNLCKEKENFLQGLEKSTPEKVEKFNTKGTNSHLKYDNVASQFTLCINRAKLRTNDYFDFSLWDFVEFLKNLAYYDDKALMCSFHYEGQYSVLTAFPCGENSLRISVFNRPKYNDYKCSTDIIINKDAFLAQIKNILENEIKYTQKLDEGNPNRYVDLMQEAVDVLEQYFNDPVDFKKTYDIPKHFRVFDIAYKNLEGVWEFYVCFDDDEKADPDYWEKQKQNGKILDYDYYEQYPKSPYGWDYNTKNHIRLTKEDVRKTIKTCMYDRVEKQNWVYCRDTNKWYSTNEIMPNPEKTCRAIYTRLSYSVKIDRELYPHSEDAELKNYIEYSYDKNGVLFPDKDDRWGLYCSLMIKTDYDEVCEIRFDYNGNQEIRAALEKIKTQEYVRFDLGEYECGKMHLWKEACSHSDDYQIAVACYKKQDFPYKKDKQLFQFTTSIEFIDCFLNALDEIENRINIMKNVLKSGKKLRIENKFKTNKYDSDIKYLEPFIGDYACAETCYGGGILNKNLEWVIKPKCVTITGKTHPKWGQEIKGFAARFNHLHNIDGKLFIVTKDDYKQFVMDINCNIKISHVSDKIYYTYLNNELWFLAVDYNKTYIVNSKGEDILTLDFAVGEKFWLFDEVIIVSKDGRYGLLDWNGKIIIDFIFSEINPKENSLDFIPVRYIDKPGFVSQSGKIYNMKIKDQSEAKL